MTYINDGPLGSYTVVGMFSLGGSFSVQLGQFSHNKDGVSTLFRKVRMDNLHVVRTQRNIN
jgi:hypothetical protein